MTDFMLNFQKYFLSKPVYFSMQKTNSILLSCMHMLLERNRTSYFCQGKARTSKVSPREELHIMFIY